MVWTAHYSIFFTLKLRGHFGGLAPMPKFAYEEKICSMYKIISLSGV